MKRRTVVRSVAFASLGLSAGCFGGISSNPGGSILVRNDDDTSHQITVKLTDDSETEFEREVELNASESVEYSDAFGGGTYGVTVNVDGEESRNDDLNVGSCGAIELHVTVTSGGAIEILQSHCD
ncbi:hypothetical protein [Halobacterium wangiae]|uniref:hypothetical protein n=1 Tax=Halobacterium wangiae TaxID=2902623 RepID=UPI001E51BA3A|nr:hypothetical protein [Halobacterium wangiae]